MTDSQKLHTAARRYCIERYNRNLHGLSITQSPQTEQNIRAGYLLLEAMRLEVERFDFDALPENKQLRELLVLSAEVATPFLGIKEDEISRQAEREIRQQFACLIENFDSTFEVEPLPYRKVLFGDELQAIAKILREKWGATKSYFYPLDEAKSSYAPTYFAYNDVDFEEAIPDEKLMEILHKRGINRVYEIREWGDENYLQDVELMNPSYTGAEVFISSGKWDWLFYASHELSVTTGGWLTQAIWDEWPNWEQAKYNPKW